MRRHSNSLEGQLRWSDFHGQFYKGTMLVFCPSFPSSSFILGKRRREISMACWNLKLWLVLENNVNFTILSPIYKIFSLLKRVLRALHPPKWCSFWKPDIHGHVISHLLPEKFPGSLETTTLLKASFLCVLWSTAASQQLFRCMSMPLSLGHVCLWICFPCFPFRFL